MNNLRGGYRIHSLREPDLNKHVTILTCNNGKKTLVLPVVANRNEPVCCHQLPMFQKNERAAYRCIVKMDDKLFEHDSVLKEALAHCHHPCMFNVTQWSTIKNACLPDDGERWMFAPVAFCNDHHQFMLNFRWQANMGTVVMRCDDWQCHYIAIQNSHLNLDLCEVLTPKQWDALSSVLKLFSHDRMLYKGLLRKYLNDIQTCKKISELVINPFSSLNTPEGKQRNKLASKLMDNACADFCKDLDNVNVNKFRNVNLFALTGASSSARVAENFDGDQIQTNVLPDGTLELVQPNKSVGSCGGNVRKRKHSPTVNQKTAKKTLIAKLKSTPAAKKLPTQMAAAMSKASSKIEQPTHHTDDATANETANISSDEDEQHSSSDEKTEDNA